MSLPKLELPELHTERLTIRPYTEQDYDEYLAVHRPGEPPSAKDADWLQKYLRWNGLSDVMYTSLEIFPYGDRAVELRGTGELVGSVGLVPLFGPFEQIDDPDSSGFTPEIGLYYNFGEAYRNRGYATEAAQALVDFVFNTLRAKRIVANTGYTNKASQAVMRKLGMTLWRNPSDDPGEFQIVGVLDNPAVDG